MTGAVPEHLVQQLDKECGLKPVSEFGAMVSICTDQILQLAHSVKRIGRLCEEMNRWMRSKLDRLKDED